MKLFLRYFIFTLFSFSSIACSDTQNVLSGYIEGAYTYISSAVGGTLFKLVVSRGQPIKKSDLLYVLDPEPEQDEARAAEADIANIQAQVVLDKLELKRQKSLYPKGATTQEAVDRAQANYTSSLNQLAANQSKLAQVNWNLSQKTMYAPVSGIVFDTFHVLGEMIEATHPVLALLAPQNIHVLFYIPESQLSQIKLGQNITFTCDHCPKKISAKISYISPQAEYTPPVIYSKNTRYKLVYLVRADLPPERAMQFHPGQPISVYLYS